ncbi:MAG: exopolysaccharide biosynthesis polyprenyl glycosylphosphotransferase [Verrucomicrobiales bacterium]|jgi:exopolysaccharide biosynthesis polyprenyl glycosylphosphotransferase
MHMAIDVGTMFLVMAFVTTRLWGPGHLVTSGSVQLGIPVAIGVLWYLGWVGIYDDAQSRRWPAAVAEVSRAVITGAVAFSLAGFVVAIGGGARRWVLLVSALWYVCLALHHGFRAAFRLNRSRVLVAGSPRQALAMRDALRRDKRRAYDIVGFVVDDSVGRIPDPASRESLGVLDDLPALVDVHDVDQVMFCMDGLTGGKFAPLARMLNRKGIEVSLTGLGDIAPRRVGVSHVEGRPVISITPSYRAGWRLLVKRVVDIVLSSVLLVLLSPPMLVTALLIRVVDGEDPIFRQRRVGKGGELFTIFKFRSMVRGAEDLQLDLTNELDGPVFKMHRDPRITQIGGFIRKTSIDELPQLVNVLLGDMSLVGPRPFIESEIVAAPESFREREAVTPGMTGHWQVSGRSDTDFLELDELDRWYVDNWSLGSDLGILVKTVPAVLRQKGAR